MPSEKRQITRNRISYSCQKCRQRKVKCDKVHPACGSCQKTGEECVYTSNDPEQQPGQDPHLADPAHAKKRKQSSPDSLRGETSYDGCSASTNLEDQLSQLSTLLNQLSYVAGAELVDPAQPVSQQAQKHREILTPDSQNSTYNSLTKQNGQERAHDTRPTRAIETASTNDSLSPNLNSILTQLEQLNTLLRVRQVDLTTKTQNDHGLDHPSFKPTGQSTTAELEPQINMPTEEQRNVFFRCWLASVYPVLPIVDPAEVLLKYKALNFWYSYGLEKGDPNPAEEYVPLIFAIYYAGAISMSLRAIQKWFPGTHRQRLLEMLHEHYNKSLKAPLKFLSSPPTLAARIMMCYMSPQGSREIGLTSTVAPLVRTAYSCNLHREKINESMEPRAAEMRRRLWWETVNLDSLESTASNMPPTINHHYCDTAMLSELRDSRLGTLEAQRYEAALREGGPPDGADNPTSSHRSSVVSVIYLVMKVRTALASNNRRLLNINLAAKPKTKEDMAEIRKALEEVDRFLKFNIGRIPTKGVPELDFTPTTGKFGQSLAVDYAPLWAEELTSNEVDFVCELASTTERWEVPYMHQYRQAMAAFHKYARILLSMCLDQCHCFSYAPFVRSTKNKVWEMSRQCALKHSHSCLRKFNALATDLELERFRWTWPNMYQPIHACIIILIDTYEKPDSREAPQSRALFDQMLGLANPAHGIVGGENGVTNVRPLREAGSEAYSMLMQLRAKAWQKAGLDPNFLWTVDEQVAVGVAAPPTEADHLVQSIREDRIYSPSTPTNGTQPDTARLLRPIIERRSREVSHPSQAAVPEEVDMSFNYSFLEGDSTTPKRSILQLVRANCDQPQIFDDRPHETGGYRTRPGYRYNFRPPSDLYDVNELIRKIREVQQANPKPDNSNDNSSQLYRQIATANNDLTKFLAENFSVPDPSDPNTERRNPIDTDTQPPPVTPLPTSSGFVHIPAPATVAEEPSAVLTQPTLSAPLDTLPPPSADHLFPAQPAKEPSDHADMVNMDFDWERWDEVFGHLIDDLPDTMNLDSLAFAT